MYVRCCVHLQLGDGQKWAGVSVTEKWRRYCTNTTHCYVCKTEPCECKERALSARSCPCLVVPFYFLISTTTSTTRTLVDQPKSDLSTTWRRRVQKLHEIVTVSTLHVSSSQIDFHSLMPLLHLIVISLWIKEFWVTRYMAYFTILSKQLKTALLCVVVIITDEDPWIGIETSDIWLLHLSHCDRLE